MSNVGKVSFSFSKITKKPSLQVQPKEIVKKVDKIEYIDSIEDNSVQVINGEDVEENKPLVIPLLHPNLLLQSVIDTVKSRAEKNQDKNEDGKENGSDESKKIETTPEDGSEKVLPPKKETLEEMATRELIEEATDQGAKNTVNSTLTVPLSIENDKEESTMDDYENIPVNDFGLAMLRGMGWDPKKGIGKNGQIVKVAGPTLRPKGLGLGADKSIASQKPVGKNVSEKEVLGKGSKVRITVGPHKNLYGTVEGFDDDAGRINVFMAISTERISINESFVQLVTPDEFSKYSKVININAYNNYIEKESSEATVKQEEDTDRKNKNGRSHSPDLKKPDVKETRHNTSKYEKSNKYDSEEEKYSKDSRRGSSSSHRDKKYNNKKYDSSPEPDYRKHEKTSKSSSSKDRHRSKQYDSDDNKKDYKYKSKYESSKSRPSKKYSSDSDSSSDDKHKSKSRSKNSRRDRERKRSPHGNSDDYDKRSKNKNKKKRNRSRSRSRR